MIMLRSVCKRAFFSVPKRPIASLAQPWLHACAGPVPDVLAVRYAPVKGRRFYSQSPSGPNMNAWVSPDAQPAGANLKKFTVDLTQKAKDGILDPVIGRDEEIRRMIQILSRRTKNNPVLIGSAGVGKTALAEGLATRIVDGLVPDSMKNKIVLSLDVGSLVAGTSMRGEFEARLKGILKDIEKDKDQYILFIDELHLLVGAGQAEGGNMDAGNMLKPALARGEIRCVGATTLDEYRKYIEKDAALARRFQSVYVAEPTVEDAISILRGIKERYEVHHGVRIADGALVAAAQLSHRYITDRFLPDKAIDLIDEAASRLRLQQESKPEQVEAQEKKIIQLKIEREALRQESDKASKQRLTTLESDLAAREKEFNQLVGQWQAEKRKLEEAKSFKQKIEAARRELDNAQRMGNWTRVAELNYSVIPHFEQQLAELEQQQQVAAASSAGGRLVSSTVTAEDIAAVIARQTGIPVASMVQTERDKILHLEDTLRSQVVGQEEAIHAVANAIRLSRAGLKSASRPISNFMFVGQSGTGKTLTVRAIAQALFNSADAMTVINMAELGDPQLSVSKLLGASAGYVGYEEGGLLTEPVRRRPYQVVLFDEFEKAHRNVQHVLLRIMDEGFITDGHGRKVDFRNTLIVLTSNLGSEALAAMPENTPRKVQKDAVMEAVREHCAPEFINRIDEIILFNRLTMKDMHAITELRIKEVAANLSDRGIGLKVDSLAKDWLSRRGFDPAYGARPLRRVLQQSLLSPLAVKMLNGDVPEGSTVQVTCNPVTADVVDLEQALQFTISPP
ncbi:mitochondrial ATP-dependent Clp protease ATP-binding subunit ClpB [Andalucia godoyi]|uniref:Mitochondrial ATP-dependent Clp protease ATP-binding subunit ClpB n=1 Tax=Andalucia godoyi TaxID=505711 RepID=A0A8K0AGK6_ANDGO|nr:mitochondrial ATP-dependent Clp protease ATP-binding subunit ClpB [Andalucia godoyi]|eukprot:ANDGO_05778.mRNA.1 mitochondrial ATP-dependent Clp protease ATP-binding subunit ClpB